MKRFTVSSLLVIAVLLTGGPVSDAAGQCKRQGQGKGAGGGACGSTLGTRFESLPSQELGDAERTAVMRIREDEKLARDVYTTLGRKWDLPVFDNIALAEQNHMDHVALLITRYELKDPVVDDVTGAFTDPELAALYAKLVAKGEASLEGALQVGATIEDLDLFDLQKMIDASDNQDIHLVANNLAKGSRNHIRAFTKVMSKKGYQAYAAQYLTQEKVDQIIAAERERRVVYDETGAAIVVAGAGGHCARTTGQGGCKDQGQGQGQGKGKCKGRGQGQGRGCCRGAGPAPEEG